MKSLIKHYQENIDSKFRPEMLDHVSELSAYISAMMRNDPNIVVDMRTFLRRRVPDLVYDKSWVVVLHQIIYDHILWENDQTGLKGILNFLEDLKSGKPLDY